MSKSLGNTILLSDSPQEIQKKLMTAYTDPKKIKLADPGNPDGCTIFAFQKLCCSAGMDRVEEDCRGGRIGCVSHKKEVAAAIAEWLAPIREKIAYYEQHRSEAEDIIADGDRRASLVAKETMRQVRDAMGMG